MRRSFDFSLQASLISSSRIWTRIVGSQGDIASTTRTRFSIRVVNSSLQGAKKTLVIACCMKYFDQGTPVVFFSLFPCLYANKPEGCDISVSVFRNACNVVTHISGH